MNVSLVNASKIHVFQSRADCCRATIKYTFNHDGTKSCSFREPGKVPPELAVLPPEDIRHEEFDEERRQWREPRARRNMTGDVRQYEDVLVKL